MNSVPVASEITRTERPGPRRGPRGAALLVLLVGMAPGASFGAASEASPLQLPPARTASAPIPPPVPLASPVDYFRQLLAADASERSRLLAEKPSPQRELIEAKLREYRGLRPDEREARLVATEMRWFLRPLLELKPEDRAIRLAQVPARLRPAIAQRIQAWDSMSPDTQAELLRFERALREKTLARGAPGAMVSVPPLPDPLAARAQDRLEHQLAEWRTLSAERRARALRRFELFFEQSPQQQEHTLGALPQGERELMDSTMQAFARLAPGQRRQCLEAFARFASLTPADRAGFLRNAEAWGKLTPEERETWRRLVTRMPPLPPGLGSPPIPPAPAQALPSTPGPALATTNH